MFFLCYAWVVSAQTSTYYPFPTADAAWYYKQFEVSIGNNSYFDFFHKLSISGDTVINAKQYKKIVLATVCNTVSTVPIGNGPQSTTTTSYSARPVAVIREENKRVYVMYFQNTRQAIQAMDWVWVKEPVNTEHILYDFNLNIGDTLMYNYIDASYHISYVLTGIDSIALGNSYRKNYHYKVLHNTIPHTDTVSVIEGVGSRSFLFTDIFPLENKAGDGLRQTIRCFEGEELYHLIGNQPCFPLLDDDIDVMVYPNPSTSEVNFKITADSFTGVYSLYATNGQLIQSGIITNPKFSVNIAGATAGLYVVKIIPDNADDSVLLKKIIVTPLR